MDVQQYLQHWDDGLPAYKKNEVRDKLIIYINDLLLRDLNQLLTILYRVDVSEQKLKTALAEKKGKDSGELIADLLIKRQEEKLTLRRSSPPAGDISQEERW